MSLLPIKDKELLSKTPKSATSDSGRDSSVATLPQNDKLTAFTKNPKSNASLRSHALPLELIIGLGLSSGFAKRFSITLGMTNLATRKGNPHIINTCNGN
ncbi:hypothetical protein CQA63_08345 [Helicobacter marmotae]|uniref:Uncharacterized protein n=2 Tax=Helicobacter marmotae TaxID=152490 RepID=A0A3D8I1P7_9HELI|nr:hypothetical protein CQA63_08345 [Helicobacter marmotae]